MAKTTVVHVNNPDGYDVYIGRAVPRRGLKASPWANPFRLGDYHPRHNRVMTTNAELVDAYAYWVMSSQSDSRAKWIRVHAHELRGSRLGCWCKDKAHPDRPCHGDFLVELSEENGG